jgi:hypothetical protein
MNPRRRPPLLLLLLPPPPPPRPNKILPRRWANEQRRELQRRLQLPRRPRNRRLEARPPLHHPPPNHHLLPARASPHGAVSTMVHRRMPNHRMHNRPRRLPLPHCKRQQQQLLVLRPRNLVPVCLYWHRRLQLRDPASPEGARGQCSASRLGSSRLL